MARNDYYCWSFVFPILLMFMQEWKKAAKRLGWYGYFPKSGGKYYGRRQRRPYNCEPDVRATQMAWRQAILDISAEYLADPQGSQYIERAEDAINELYGYDLVKSKVMFKPTLAVQDPFRATFIGALSYFVGYEATQDRGGIEEDKGFAIAGGDTWSEVEFEDNQTSCVGDVALSQGYYYFTNAADQSRTGVEYSFVYKKVQGKLKIIVHHSSLPAPTR